MARRFDKPFTQQEPIPEAGIERAVAVLRSGRLHRYNTEAGELGEAALLEREYADFQGVPYCLACASGGYALHIALKACGLRAGDKVLSNAFTLAPVPGAIDNAGGVPVLVEVDENLRADLDHLDAQMRASGARFLLLSHMRGHIVDMDRVVALCERYGVTLIEDCAHTMGARWNGVRSGNFGAVACFSTQTYKHLNSGEGGLLTTADPALMARAVLLSGSYMLYERHGAAPDPEAFAGIRLETPNYSGRMDNLRAAVLRAQLPQLDDNCRRWNTLYAAAERALAAVPGIALPRRPEREDYVASSIQFRLPQLDAARIERLLQGCAARGVELKWFGGADPQGFTSRFDSWRYLGQAPELPQTLRVLASTLDMRLPLTFDTDDITAIAAIIAEEVAAVSGV